MMTERLYYHDSFLCEFDAEIVEITAMPGESRSAVLLNQTAFYPTSGGQIFDTGAIVATGSSSGETRAAVTEVVEREDGAVLHFVDDSSSIKVGSRVRGLVDISRRRDHMQQHSGQHVLSAAFIQLFSMPTVSFHMGSDYCSIDLDARALSSQQSEQAERLANEVILEDRPLNIRFVTQEEARTLGLRKIPPVERGELRLIDISNFDLTACGGTHVASTGQIGSILLRKVEKSRQGIRVEFVCGMRAVQTARHDYNALAETAALFSAQLWDVPQQVRKSQDEAKEGRRARERLLDELAEQHAIRLLSETAQVSGRKVIAQVFADRDLNFIKPLAQKLTRAESNVVALLGAGVGQPSLVFAQSAGQASDMGALLKETLASLGGRGGGTRDMAQGGVSRVDQLSTAVEAARSKISVQS